MESPISEASLDYQEFQELNNPTTPVPYYELQDVIKESEEASENLFVVEEASIYFPTFNGKKLANVLTQAQPHRKLRLRGRIVVDSDQEDQLIIYENRITLNGAWIIYEGDFSNFSIAFPNTLWITTHLGHLEIRASREYHDIFTEMMHAIGIFYVALFYYEDYGLGDEYEKDFNHMAAIFNFYTVHVDGRGLFFKDVLDITLKHSKFMLNEYIKEKSKGKLHGDHMFFYWLKDGCKTHKGFPVTSSDSLDLSPGKYRQYFEKFRQRMKKQHASPEPLSNLTEPISDLNQIPVDQQAQSSWQPSIASAVATRLTMKKPFHGNYISPQFPHGVDIHSTIPEKIAALICHAVSSGRRQLQKLTINSVAGALHRDYSVCYRLVCHELINIYRASIITLLPTSPSWKTSELYRDLSAQKFLSAISPTHQHHLKMQESIKDYVNGVKKLVHRENKCVQSSTLVPTSPKTTAVITSQQTQQNQIDNLAVEIPHLPNRDPSIISLSLNTSSKAAHSKYHNHYGIRRSAYRALDRYD